MALASAASAAGPTAPAGPNCSGGLAARCGDTALAEKPATTPVNPTAKVVAVVVRRRTSRSLRCLRVFWPEGRGVASTIEATRIVGWRSWRLDRSCEQRRGLRTGHRLEGRSRGRESPSGGERFGLALDLGGNAELEKGLGCGRRAVGIGLRPYLPALLGMLVGLEPG
jgi:hypothetical protein